MNSEEREWRERAEQAIDQIRLRFMQTDEEIQREELYSLKEFYWTAVLLMEKLGRISNQRVLEEVQASFEKIKTIQELTGRARKLFQSGPS